LRKTGSLALVDAAGVGCSVVGDDVQGAVLGLAMGSVGEGVAGLAVGTDVEAIPLVRGDMAAEDVLEGDWRIEKVGEEAVTVGDGDATVGLVMLAQSEGVLAPAAAAAAESRAGRKMGCG
jgi:hypothetical protein